MKTKKDIIYCTVKEAKVGTCDIGIWVDGNELVDMDFNEAFDILQKYNMIKKIDGDDCIIIPAGLKFKSDPKSSEYMFGDEFIFVDLALDDIDIKEYC